LQPPGADLHWPQKRGRYQERGLALVPGVADGWAHAETGGEVTRKRYRVLLGGGSLVIAAVLAIGVLVLTGKAVMVRDNASRSVGTSRSPSSSKGTPLDPQFFATGSCMALPPTSRDRHLTVFLDAGHGGIDPGGIGVNLP